MQPKRQPPPKIVRLTRYDDWSRWSMGFGAIVLIGCLTGCQSNTVPKGEWMEVRRVVSGQTLEVVEQPGRKPEQVRLIGVSAPDLKQAPWGTESQQQLEQLLTESRVLLESDVEERDRFDRRLAYVWQGDRLVNEDLIASGHALASIRSPNTRHAQRLARAQERSRLLGLGIWNPENPLRQTPTEFRKQSP